MNELINNDPISEHLLLTMAKTYPVFDGDLAPKECRYDLFQGAWLLEGLGSLFVESPNRPQPRTKKFDIETGEDQKGE